MLLPNSFDKHDFLQNYWQKKPMLIRAEKRDFTDPVSPEELAGLACEEFIESRLINFYPTEKATGKDTIGQAEDSAKTTASSAQLHKHKWKLRHGPFKEKDFLKLPDRNYTLLVQAVDQWHEGVRAMLGDFNFLPSWRIDDIMVSYSTDGGNVGPHFDYYDVFLIQGLGKKRWQLGGHADSNSKRLPNKDLRLLADFEPEQEWLLEPGDILYLPPNVAHYGIAMGNSLTYSIGFRTPSHAEIIGELGDELIEQLREEDRYIDTDPQIPDRHGEIPDTVIQQLQSLLLQQLTRPELIANWFGRSMTNPKYPDISVIVEEKLTAETLRQTMQPKGISHQQPGKQVRGFLFKNPAARFAFRENKDKLQLFADGCTIECAADQLSLVLLLCASEELPDTLLDLLPTDEVSAFNLLAQLYNQGSLLLDYRKP